MGKGGHGARGPGRRQVMALIGIGLLTACAEREVRLPGPRLDLNGLPPAGQVDRALPITLPAQSRTASWTHRAATPTHLMPHAALSPTPQPLWAVQIGHGNERRHRITADPVSDGARIYAMDSRATVSAVSPAGQLLWQRDLSRPLDNADDASGGALAVAGAVVYAATEFSELTALNAATGSILWQQRFDAPVTGGPTISGSQIYVTTRDSRGWVLDAANGRLRWQVQGAPSVAGVTGGAGPAVDGTFAFFPFPSQQIIAAYKAEGYPAWRGSAAGGRLGSAYAGLKGVTGDPVVSGERVYVGTPGGRVVALDRQTGERIWTAEEGATAPVVVAGGSVFTVSDDAALVRLSAADGRRIWKTGLPDYVPTRNPRRKRDVFAHYGPILAGGRLWVASNDGLLRGFNPVNGQKTAEIPLGHGATTGAIVVAATLYLVTDDGMLRAFH